MKKYVVVSKNEYRIYKKRPSMHPSYERLILIDKITTNGPVLTIIGEEVLFGIHWEGHSEVSMDDVVPNEIKNKKFLWWKWKALNTGWVELKKRKSVTIETSTYKIIKGDTNDI